MTADDRSVPEVVTAEPARPRRRSILIASIVGVVAVLVAGTFAALGGAGKSTRVRVAAETPATTAVATSTNESTSTSTTTTSTTPESSSVPGTGPAGDSAGAPVVQPVQPNDLTGAISFAGATIRIGEETPFTLTIRNISDHPISLPGRAAGQALVVLLNYPAYPDFPGEEANLSGQLPLLAPGASHTFTGSIFPNPAQSGLDIGPVQVVAELVGEWPTSGDERREPIAGIPAAPLTVVPPGWHAGMPLDPSLGSWTAVMSADTTTIADDGTAVVNATIRNVNDQTALTRAYGSLAIMCGPARAQFWSPFVDHVVDPATLAPGQEQTFSFELDLPDVQAHGATTARTLARVQCSVGLKVDNVDPYNFLAQPDDTIDSDIVTLTVTHPPATASTTTTQPPPTTQP